MKCIGILLLFIAAIVAAIPLERRGVQSLDLNAFKEAQQKDETATRALSSTQIKTSDGRCLRVDMLSGDSVANLTPVQVAECGTTNGQLWDIITAGRHNDRPGQMLIVNTLTQACFNVDPAGSVGDSVYLFSCGGRADGGGQVTGSQLFAFDGSAGPLALQPRNAQGQCLYASGNELGIQACDSSSQSQSFTFANGASSVKSERSSVQDPAPRGAPVLRLSFIPKGTPTPQPLRVAFSALAHHQYRASMSAALGPRFAGTGIPASTPTPTVPAAAPPFPTAAPPFPTSVSAVPTAFASLVIPVSQDGGVLQPTAAAAANQFDVTAIRAARGANIRAPDGRCLSIDPSAGDSRQNLIPIQLDECRGDETQKFDIVTRGRHNDGTTGVALIVSTLTNGCISFDGRNRPGSRVFLFSCGGRADGEGQTDAGQLFPYDGNSTSLVMEPQSEGGRTCLVAGSQRLDSGSCGGNKSAFQIVNIS
ncbi:Kinesin-like protein KIF13B [Escovopsis weberi]|uniref:Kinesin-like protein KIF13B n=1 Tax=Escovopsis weberi TaxID=150374 RepID=A0A0M9VVH6_ESCWE|nr:Kinesin-like protein KIF13B [Escovopsis weberi]